jgi:cold shock protein
MSSVGIVREWNDDEGMGVIDSEDTPGGCWVHFSHIVTDALGTLTPGDQVTFTYEVLPQDGFDYQAVRVWPPGVKPGTPQRAPHRGPSAAYQSSLTIRWGSDQGRTELERHLGVLYVAVRDSMTVDRQVAFDTAANQLEYFPQHAEARELAEASLADGDEPRLASAAAAFLDAIGYEPGFEQAPERFARLERALDAVRADMRATGLTGEIRLIRPDWTPNAAVETWAGDHGWTAGIFSSEAADDLSALVAVAEQARQAIMESLEYQSTRAVWPACPAHGLGAAPMAHHGTGVWWCDGGGGHVAAEIGHWATRQQALA